MVPALPFHTPYSKYPPLRALQAFWYNDLVMQYCVYLDSRSKTVKRSFTSGLAAVEHISVGRRPSIEEPKASRYKEKKYTQLSLEL